MSQQARVIATLYGSVRHPEGTASYLIKAVLEYAILFGTPVRSAKFPIEILYAKNEEDLRDSMKDLLVAELNTKYPGNDFRSRDVMLFGV